MLQPLHGECYLNPMIPWALRSCLIMTVKKKEIGTSNQAPFKYDKRTVFLGSHLKCSTRNCSLRSRVWSCISVWKITFKVATKPCFYFWYFGRFGEVSVKLVLSPVPRRSLLTNCPRKAWFGFAWRILHVFTYGTYIRQVLLGDVASRSRE